jgi:hypothetical protein
VTQGLVNDGGLVSAVEGLSIVTGASLSNVSGRLLAGGNLDVQVAGDLRGLGVIGSNGHLQVRAGAGSNWQVAGPGAARACLPRAEPCASIALRGRRWTDPGGANGCRDRCPVGWRPSRYFQRGGQCRHRQSGGGGAVRVAGPGNVTVRGPVVSDGAVILSAGAGLGVEALASGGAATLSGAGVRVEGPVVAQGVLTADAGTAVAFTGELPGPVRAWCWAGRCRPAAS